MTILRHGGFEGGHALWVQPPHLKESTLHPMGCGGHEADSAHVLTLRGASQPFPKGPTVELKRGRPAKTAHLLQGSPHKTEISAREGNTLW